MTSLNDTITTSSGTDTITLNNDGSSIWGGPMFDTITLSDHLSSSNTTGIYFNTMNSSISSSSIGSTYTINNTINGSGGWGYSNGKPFVDNFPEWNAFRKLCDEYPGLERAYQNLKTFYTMCYADSILPKDDK